MARLHISEIDGLKVCIVADVIMPDRSRRNYAACGENGLREIIERIQAEAKSLKRSRKCLVR